MAFQQVGLFLSLLHAFDKKSKFGPEKKCWAFKLLILTAQIALKLQTYSNPWR